jgi:GNAT superfamily N-acetyltransferase
VNAATTVRPAHASEASYLAQLMALAFHEDPVSRWLIPDPDERIRRQPDFFRVFVDRAFARGEVHTTDSRDAVALWFAVDPESGDEADETTERRVRRALGPHHTAFTVLTRLMGAVHPAGLPHAYLPFVAVHPRLWGQGTGSRLLGYKLTALDATGTPSYLEASSIRSRHLYRRLGYRQLLQQIPLPNGPSMYPMWRAPVDRPAG